VAFAQITKDVLDIATVVNHVRSDKNGGLVTFSGDVRDNDGGKTVTAIDYHCYQALAVKELQQIVITAEKTWPGTICAAIHRVGSVKVGESSVIIAVSAPHRAEAFDTCRWIIDTIKVSLPIWKREEFEGAKAEWIEGDHHIDAAQS
jgi:molybdopterin synthase catalytic subunit